MQRQIQTALYTLKRQFGGSVDVCHLLDSTADPKTGAVSQQTVTTRINRAIVLPVKISREVIKGISAVKQVGTIDTGRRQFIIDRRDAPSLMLKKDDWLVYDGGKYAIESIEEYEFKSAWVVTAKHLAGEQER